MKKMLLLMVLAFVMCACNYAVADDTLVQVDFSLQSNDSVTDSIVNAAILYKDDLEYVIPPEDVIPKEGVANTYYATIPCVAVQRGAGSFTLKAVYEDGESSPASGGFNFTIPLCTRIVINTMDTVVVTTVETN